MSANDAEDIVVTNNADEHRYEARVNGQLAVLVYELDGDTIVYLHTDVPPALEGRGIAGKLAKTALDDARAQGRSIAPLCPYVAAYIRRHPEYRPLVVERRTH